MSRVISFTIFITLCLPVLLFANLPLDAENFNDAAKFVSTVSGNSIHVKCEFSPESSDVQTASMDNRSITRFVAVPTGTKVVIGEVFTEATGGEIPSAPQTGYYGVGTSPASVVVVGNGWVMDGIEFVPVTVNRQIWHGDDSVTFLRKIKFDLELPPGSESPRLRGRMLRETMKGLLLNDVSPHRDQIDENGGYVYVVPDDNRVREAIADLADWRRLQGFEVHVLTVLNWMAATDIHDELKRLHGEGAPIEFICLVGDAGGEFSVPTAVHGTSDYHYALLTRNSLIPNAAVGRLSYNSIRELQRVVDKVLQYEKEPDFDDFAWMRRGAVVAGNPLSGRSTILVGKWVRDRMLENGFAEVDTFWYTMGRSIESFFRDQFEHGTAFVNYRGWSGMEDWTSQEMGRLNNRYLPVALFLGCNTGDFEGMGAGYTEALLRAQGGAIGAIGSVGSQNRVNYNNTLLAGYYTGLLEENVLHLGWTLNRAKMELYSVYGSTGNELATNHAYWTNLMGDPGTVLWRGEPRDVEIEVGEEFVVGEGPVEVTVTSGDDPVSGVRVGLYKENQISAAAYTDDNGVAVIEYSFNNVDDGEASVTVSGDRILPATEVIQFESPPHLLGFVDYLILDDNQNPRQGNNDGVCNPFETVRLTAILRNHGAQQIREAINFTLVSGHNSAQIQQGNFVHRDPVNPGNQVFAHFLVRFTGAFPHDEKVLFTVTARSGDERWVLPFDLTGEAPQWSVVELDGDVPLPRGGQATLDIRLKNTGAQALGQSDAVLVSRNEFAELLQEEAEYEQMAPGEMSFGDQMFLLTTNWNVPFSSELEFELQLRDDNGHTAVLPLTIPVESAPNNFPTGPDSYGYWAIDNTDNQSNLRPAFNWIELYPGLNGQGRDTQLLDQGEDDDKSVVIPLPFTFTYYGEEYDKLTVCTNGWAAFGDQGSYVDFRNYPIGTPQGPKAQLCPWWDDLYQPGIEGGVYYRFFPERHIFVVEWFRMKRWVGPNGPGATETFELILHDPEWYPTVTGDGDIIFQYADATNERRVDAHGTPFATIGIGDPDDEAGLQYSHWNQYAEGADQITRGSAIRFATASSHAYGSVNGTVFRLGGEEPIPGAVVRCSTGGWAVTDENGTYEIENVLAGRPFRLTGHAAGFNVATSEELEVERFGDLQVVLQLRNPSIDVDLEEVADTLDAGMRAQARFAVSNGGNGPLRFTIGFDDQLDQDEAIVFETSGLRRDEPNELWENIFGFNASEAVEDHRILGAAYTNEGFFVSGGNNGLNRNYLYRFSRGGRLLERIVQACDGMWGMHDLGYDGESLYGGCRDGIYVTDLDGRLLRTIRSPLLPPRGLAVDPESGDIWIANDGDPIHRLDENGNILERFSHRLRPYGLAWHPADRDGYPLYIFSADGETNLAVSKMNTETGEILPVQALELEEGDRAGGCELSLNWDTHRWSLVTVIQNAAGDRVELFDAGLNLSWLSADPEQGEVDAEGEQVCQLIISSVDLDGGDYFADMVISHNAEGGETRVPVQLTVDAEVAGVIDDVPKRYELSAIYPNPSNSVSFIQFSLPHPGPVILAVWDNRGRLVSELLNGTLQAGRYREIFSAEGLASGVYFVRLTTGNLVLTRKFALLK